MRILKFFGVLAVGLFAAFTTLTIADSYGSMQQGGAAIVVLSLIVLYFGPSIVGHRKQNAPAIFALNLFLGWTIIGWVVALVWALTKEPERIVAPA